MGAERTINTNKADLIISTYHLASDYIEIPQTLGKIVDIGEYEFNFRHHTLEYAHSVIYMNHKLNSNALFINAYIFLNLHDRSYKFTIHVVLEHNFG